MATSKKEVRPEGLEAGSVQPSPTSEVIRWVGPDLTRETKFIQDFSRKINRRLPTHNPSLGTTERYSSPTISNEKNQGFVVIVKEGAD